MMGVGGSNMHHGGNHSLLDNPELTDAQLEDLLVTLEEKRV